jgi:hypothetical protein
MEYRTQRLNVPATLEVRIVWHCTELVPHLTNLAKRS